MKTMLRLTTRRRALLAEKVADVANLVTAAIVIGFSLGDRSASWLMLLGALAIWVGVLLFVLVVVEGTP